MVEWLYVNAYGDVQHVILQATLQPSFSMRATEHLPLIRIQLLFLLP